MSNRVLVDVKKFPSAVLQAGEDEWIGSIEPFVKDVLLKLGKSRWEVSVLFCDDNFIRDLNALYLSNPALWQKDYSEDGFSWIDTSSTNPLVYGYKRTNGIDSYSVYINLGKEAVRIQPDSPEFQVVLSSGWKKYGGNEEEKSGNGDCLVLQPLSGFILKD